MAVMRCDGEFECYCRVNETLWLVSRIEVFRGVASPSLRVGLRLRYQFRLRIPRTSPVSGFFLQ